MMKLSSRSIAIHYFQRFVIDGTANGSM